MKRYQFKVAPRNVYHIFWIFRSKIRDNEMTPTKLLEQETENASVSGGVAQFHPHTLLVDEIVVQSLWKTGVLSLKK